jgi:hypothetical protein
MRKTFQIAATAIFPFIALAGQAKATTLVLSSPYSADFIWNNNGTVSLLSAPLVDYTAVQQQSELWSDFSPGSTLPAGSLMELSFAHVGGHDHHTISFLHAFGSVGGTFTWNYDVSDVGSVATEGSMSAAILQTVGSSALVKTIVDNNSNTYTINFTQNGTTDTGTTSVAFLPGTTTLDVTDKITISGLYGSDATGVSNSIVENSVPEPATWVMMVLGFAGLGFAGYRKADRMSSAAA